MGRDGGDAPVGGVLDVTPDQVRAAWEAATLVSDEEPPEGCYTIAMLAEIFNGLTERATRDRVARGIKAGTVEHAGEIRKGGRAVAIYRLVKKDGR